MISLKVLVEDTGSEHKALRSEHGLSLYVDLPSMTLLFDCGATGLAFENAPLMHPDLSKIDAVVISHSHYDHAGGFPKLLSHVKPRTLYTGEGFWDEKFGVSDGGLKYTYLGAGFGADDVLRWGVRHVVCTDTLELSPEAWLMSGFRRTHDFETIPARFVCGNDHHADDFRDEVCLVLREGDGVAVVTGCSHPGILNIVETVHERLGLPVTSVVGGTHLMEASDERIDRTLAELQGMGMHRMALCHCSGEAVRKRLSKMGGRGCPLGTGDMLYF